MTIKWKTSSAVAIPVTLMETRHLHYTIRLVWNTFMPEELRLGNERSAIFNNLDIYNPQYMQDVVSAMYSELTQSRDDELQAWMLEELDHMQLSQLLAVIPKSFEEHLNGTGYSN